MPDPTEFLRYVNAFLAGYVLVQCLRPVAVRWWRARPAELRFLLMGMLALMIAAGWGTAESITTAVPGGTRVPALTLALAWTATGVTLLHHRIRKDPS